MTDHTNDVAARRERLKAMKGRMPSAVDAVTETRERLGGADPDSAPSAGVKPPPANQPGSSGPAPVQSPTQGPTQNQGAVNPLAALLGLSAPGHPLGGGGLMPGGPLGGGLMGGGLMGGGLGLRRGARARTRAVMGRWLRSTLYETPDDGRGMVADTPVTQAGLSALLEALHHRAASPTAPGARLVGQALTMLSEGGEEDSEIVQGIKVAQLKKLLALLEAATPGGGMTGGLPGGPSGKDPS